MGLAKRLRRAAPDRSGRGRRARAARDRSGRGRRALARTGLVVVWALAAALAGLGLLRLSGLEAGFPFTIALAAFPYVAPLGLVLALLAALARRRTLAVAFAVAALLCVVVVAPRALPGGASGVEGSELTVLTSNLRYGHADPEQLVALAERLEADVVAFQELPPAALPALRRAGLDRLLRHRSLIAAEQAEGSGIWARWPLRRLPGVEPSLGSVPSARAETRLPSGERLDVLAVHALAPLRPSAIELWEEGLDAVPGAPESGSGTGLVMGDFNATLDHAQLRDVIADGYVDAGDAAGGGLAPTWPEGRFYPPVTIDHVLVSEDVEVAGYGVEELEGTDHEAVWARLVVPEG